MLVFVNVDERCLLDPTWRHKELPQKKSRFNSQHENQLHHLSIHQSVPLFLVGNRLSVSVHLPADELLRILIE
jgi:hypothetical protein